jgi:hypothetical protein
MCPLKGVNPSIELSAISYELAQRAFAFPARPVKFFGEKERSVFHRGGIAHHGFHWGG